MRHLIVVPVVDSCLMELLNHGVNLLRAANKGAEGELVVRTLRFDFRNVCGARSDRLKHAAHATDETNLVLEDSHAMTFGLSLLSFFVLFSLLFFEEMFNFFAIDGIRLLAIELNGAAFLHQVFHHVTDLFHQERHRPFEEIHSLRQVEGMLDVLVLLDVHFVVLNKNDGTLVVVLSTVVGSREDCNDGGEGLVTTPSVHLVSIDLDLMGPNHGNKVVGAKDLLDGIKTELD